MMTAERMKYCPTCAAELRVRDVDGSERLACAAAGCGFVFWNNPLPVVAAVVRWRGQFVLARNVRWPAGLFSMITGFVERDETPEVTLQRELREELGLGLARAAFIGHYAFAPANQLLVAFLADGAGELCVGSDLAEAKLVKPEELAGYDFGPLSLTATVVRDAVKLLGTFDSRAFDG